MFWGREGGGDRAFQGGWATPPPARGVARHRGRALVPHPGSLTTCWVTLGLHVPCAKGD